MSSSSNELDITNASRGVWLVKVPKYMSTRWQKALPMTEVGRLKITKYDIYHIFVIIDINITLLTPY